MGKPFGEALHMARFRRGLTLRDVGDAIGAAPSTPHRVEHGHDVWLSNFARLVIWMGLTSDELMQIIVAESADPEEEED